MPHIEELRRKRAGINEQVQALATIDASGSTLTAEQLTEFANLQQQFTDISAKIERLEAAERAAALVAKPVKATQQAPGIIVKQEPKQYTGAGMTRLVMSVAAGAGNLQDAAKFASEELNDQSVSMAISTAAASGGVLIPQNLHSEVIELLSDRTIVRKLGARPVPLPNGNMTLPRVAGGATASYTGENKDAKTSETRFDDVKLTAKTLIAMVPISNALIGRAGFNVEQLVLQDILTAISVREDKAFMRDDGTGDTPIGMKARATQWNRLLPWEADAAINLNTVDEYLDKIILMAMDGNSNMISSGWGMSNRTYMKLFGLRDGNGNKVYPEMAQGLLKPGIYATAATAVLALVNNNTDIVADFREKSLRHTAVNTDAAVVFDALPGQVFPAHVTSSDAGILAGQEAVNGQLSQPEQSTRWVRDAQRMRIHVALDQPLDKPLPTGARATVQLYNSEGPFARTFAGLQIHLVSWLHYVY
ncbi:phage major capsid protein [Klebsiella pneumoniae]